MLRKLVGTVIVVGVLLGQMFSLQRCANPLPPKGGPKDTIGPQLVLDETTPNFQTNFRPTAIELTFDEWVQLKDPTQVLVSPPLDPAPKVSLRRKTLTIDFGDAVLRDSVTYVVNIGAAVVDITENNPPENLRFVFATGPALDSASVKGRLVNAYTKEPIKEGLFTLYANLADSAARTENPFYFSRSDENGYFEISNIKPGVYRGVALDNGGQSSYQLDERATKAIGFPDSLIIIPDGLLKLPDIRVTDVSRPLRILDKDTSSFGQINIQFDRPADQVMLRSTNSYLRIDDVDTMRLFYTDNKTDSLFFGMDSLVLQPADTLVLEARTTERAQFKGALKLLGSPSGSVSPVQPFAFVVNRPILTVNDDLLQLRKDTFPDLLPITSVKDSLAANRFFIKANLEENESYEVSLLPGAVEDIFGKLNPDTITASFQLRRLSDFGSLNLQLNNFIPTKSYLLRLVKGKDKTPTRTLSLSGSADYAQLLEGLLPGSYKLEIIRDENRNGRFDGANYDLGIQPEPVNVFTLEALRADWEVEAIIDLDDLPATEKGED